MSRGGGGGSVAQSLSFLRILESDLRSISSETRKREPETREAADRALQKLKEVDVSAERDGEDEGRGGKQSPGGGRGRDKSNEDWDADTLSSALAGIEEITTAFCVACDPSNAKVSLRAVGCLHKLINHSAIPRDRLHDVLEALQRLLDTKNDDIVLLKVLECLLSVLTSRSYRIILDEETCRVGLTLLLRLCLVPNSKDAASALGGGHTSSPSMSAAAAAILKQTAEVAFRQVASDMFLVAADEFSDDDVRTDAGAPQDITTKVSENVEPATAPETSQTAFLLFRDLCALVSGDECAWLGVQEVRLGLVLEVIEEALHGSLFQRSLTMRTLLTSRLCPVVHERLCSSSDTEVYLLLLRIVYLLVVKFLDDLQADLEVLLVLLVRMVEKPSTTTGGTGGEDTGSASTSLPNQVLVLEALRAILSHEDGVLMKRVNAVYDASDNATNLVKATILAASKLVSGSTMELSQGTVTVLMGTCTPLGSNARKASEGKTAVPAFGMCLSALKALAAMAPEDESCAKLLGETFQTLLAALVPFLERTEDTTPYAVEAITAVADAIGDVSRLGHLPALAGYENESIEALAAGAALQLASGKTTMLYPLFSALLRATLQSSPPLVKPWLPVVEVIELLEGHLSTAASTKTTSAASHPLADLRKPLESFFAQTVELDTASRRELVSSLVSVSRTKVSRAGRKPGDGMRLDAMFRIDKVMQGWLEQREGEGVDNGTWELVAGHLVAVAKDHDDKRVREIAVKIIGQLASAALGSVPDTTLPHVKVLSAMPDLMTSPHRDTRLGALAAVKRLLETRGERVHGEGAWQHVVGVLRLAVTDDSAEDRAGGGTVNATGGGSTSKPKEDELPISVLNSGDPVETPIQIGFKALQLIASDFLPVMAFSVVGAFVEVLGLYGVQKDDVNSALTSLSLLWGVADFVAKVDAQQDNDDLWRSLFYQLKLLGLDDRPEVRNGAIKSLTGTLMAHGARLSDTAWEGCILESLVPLVEKVMSGGQKPAMEPAASEDRGGGGTDGGAGPGNAAAVDNGVDDASVRVIMHHSRDTPQKQWNETRMLMLSGMGRIFRRYTPSLMSLGVFETAWRSVLNAATVAATGEGAAREIAMAGVGTMLELVTIVGGLEDSKNKEARDALWAMSWEAIDRAVWSAEHASQRKAIVNVSALMKLAEGLTSLASSLFARLAAADSLRLVSILARIVLMDIPEPKTSADAEVERVALGALTSLQFRADDTETWTSLVKQMLRLLFSQKQGRSDEFVKQNVMEALQRMYTGSLLPVRVKVLELENVLGSLLPVMAIRTSFVEAAVAAEKSRASSLVADRREAGSEQKPQPAAAHGSLGEPLWASAVSTFVVAVENGADEAGTYRCTVWPLFVGAYEQFLFPQSSKVVGGMRTPNARMVLTMHDLEDEQKSMHAKVNRLVQKYDALMVESLLLTLQRSEGAEEEVKRKLMRILAKGAVDGQRRSNLARACQGGLFKLAGHEWSAGKSEKMIVSAKAETGLTNVCKGVLGAYVRDGRRSGKCPLPAARRAEVLFLLRQLRSLRVSPNNGMRGGPRSHLLNLYPIICECIECDDDDVRTLTRDLLFDAGGALGLQYGTTPLTGK